MPAEPSPPDFSDSDQAWYERLGASDPPGSPRSSAEREADLLRRARARRLARAAAAEADSESLPADAPGAIDAPFDSAAQEQRWLRVLQRVREAEAGQGTEQNTGAGPAAAPSDPPQPQPDLSEPRQPLQPTAATPLPLRWTRRLWSWSGGGALAAAVLVGVVLVQQINSVERIYGEPPREGMRGDERVQRLDVAQPRQAAEALHRALLQAGEAAGLYQHRRVFIVLLQISSETTPAARAALAAAGVSQEPGPLRIEFHPR
jgi:hypothetical protein